jgi:hypothetical protein
MKADTSAILLVTFALLACEAGRREGADTTRATTMQASAIRRNSKPPATTGTRPAASMGLRTQTVLISVICRTLVWRRVARAELR